MIEQNGDGKSAVGSPSGRSRRKKKFGQNSEISIVDALPHLLSSILVILYRMCFNFYLQVYTCIDN